MTKLPASILSFLTLAGLTSAARAGDVAFGEYLSGECVTCHRVDGQDKGIPAIVGWPADQFVAVLQAYKAKDRANPVMQTIAGRMSTEDMAALAAYFESLKPK
jgi:cytochrome c553